MLKENPTPCILPDANSVFCIFHIVARQASALHFTDGNGDFLVKLTLSHDPRRSASCSSNCHQNYLDFSPHLHPRLSVPERLSLRSFSEHLVLYMFSSVLMASLVMQRCQQTLIQLMCYKPTEPLHFQASKDWGQIKKTKKTEREREANMPKSLHNLINARLESGEQPQDPKIQQLIPPGHWLRSVTLL